MVCSHVREIARRPFRAQGWMRQLVLDRLSISVKKENLDIAACWAWLGNPIPPSSWYAIKWLSRCLYQSSIGRSTASRASIYGPTSSFYMIQSFWSLSRGNSQRAFIERRILPLLTYVRKAPLGLRRNYVPGKGHAAFPAYFSIWGVYPLREIECSCDW